MKERWLKIPFWGKFFIIIFVSSIVLYAISEATASPEEKALRRCSAQLNKAAQGGMSNQELERMCLQMQ